MTKGCVAYQLLTVPAARKVLKKLPRAVRQHLIDELQALTENPLQTDALKPPWQFLRSLHTRYQKTDYRVVYEVDTQKKLIIVRFAATRENFYRHLRRLKLKPLV